MSVCFRVFTWGAARLALALAVAMPLSGLAHGLRVGDLLLDHPYALPSTPDEPHGKAYLRGIQNKGSRVDRLLGASTPVAAQVKLHRLAPDAQGLRGMQVDAIDLPAKSTTLLRHTGDYQLSLIDLKQPLNRQRFVWAAWNAYAGPDPRWVPWLDALRKITES
jgi:copper(I)-binding protein